MTSQTDLERLEADVLARARVGLEPSPAELDATYSSLLRYVGASVAEAGGQGGVRAAPRASGEAGGTTALWKGLLVGGGIGLLAGFGGGVAWSHQRPAKPPGIQELTVPSPNVVRSVPVEALPVPPAPEVNEAPHLSVATRSHPVSTRAKAEPPRDAQVTFYEELSHVRRAQSALKEGNPALALGLMVSLRESFPGGGLLAERGVTEVLALCKLNRVSEAEKTARRLLEQHPGSVYEARLRSSCAFGAVATELK